MGTLTKRQTDFIVHYVATRNIYQSAISAGYSKIFAKSRSHELLKNPLISEKITHLEDKYYKDQFKELALSSIKELAGVIADETNRASQLQAIKYIMTQAGVTDVDDSQTGVIEIKVRLPDDL